MSLRYNPDNPNHLRDAQHAHQLFTYYGYALAPKNPFLYHVVFALKDASVEKAAPNTFQKSREIGVLAKQIDLPGFKANIDTKQQYNRKKHIQTRIDYDEVRAVFHDDNTGITTTMLREYYNYYYRDGRNGKYNYGTRDKYSDQRNRYGLDNDTVNSFFDHITIYQLARKKWFSYTLVNPILSGWQHDTLDYSDGSGMMENTINISYEAVLYDRGDINATLQPGSSTVSTSQITEPVGFTSEATGYDIVHSPLISNGSASGQEPKLGAIATYDKPDISYVQQQFNPNAETINFERGLSPVIKNNTQLDETIATTPSFNALNITQPMSPEELTAELEKDPAIQDTLAKQSVLKGQIEGFSSANITEYESLSAGEQEVIKQTVVSQATSTDRSSSVNVKSAVLATNIVEEKKKAKITTRTADTSNLDPPISPAERAADIDRSIKSKTRLRDNLQRTLDRVAPGGPLEGTLTSEEIARKQTIVNNLNDNIQFLEAERSFLP